MHLLFTLRQFVINGRRVAAGNMCLNVHYEAFKSERWFIVLIIAARRQTSFLAFLA
jgi:hypothetical protein